MSGALPFIVIPLPPTHTQSACYWAPFHCPDGNQTCSHWLQCTSHAYHIPGICFPAYFKVHGCLSGVGWGVWKLPPKRFGAGIQCPHGTFFPWCLPASYRVSLSLSVVLPMYYRICRRFTNHFNIFCTWKADELNGMPSICRNVSHKLPGSYRLYRCEKHVSLSKSDVTTVGLPCNSIYYRSTTVYLPLT